MDTFEDASLEEILAEIADVTEELREEFRKIQKEEDNG
jgi:hypothetical protein